MGKEIPEANRGVVINWKTDGLSMSTWGESHATILEKFFISKKKKNP